MTSQHYIHALLETIRESFLILDPELRVVEANLIFCETFKVTKTETEGQLIYKLGNGQWDIPVLKKMLEDILPTKKTIKDYEISWNFPTIGEKIILLNANQIDSMKLILLAFEDITEKRRLERGLAEYAKGLEVKIIERTKQLSSRIKELEALNKTMIGRELKMVELKKEVEDLKQFHDNTNDNHKDGQQR